MPRESGGNHAVSSGEPHFILESHCSPVGAGNRSRYLHVFVIPRGAEIAAVRLRHCQQNPVIKLKILIAKSSGQTVIHAGNFHPYQIVGVVNHTHLIGLGVADPDAGESGRQCHCFIMVA